MAKYELGLDDQGKIAEVSMMTEPEHLTGDQLAERGLDSAIAGAKVRRASTVADDNGPLYQFGQLRELGLLWLINTSVFHPRGYALALTYDDHDTEFTTPLGFRILGDGSEPWTMGDPPPERIAAGDPTLDDLFKRAAILLAPKDWPINVERPNG